MWGVVDQIIIDRPIAYIEIISVQKKPVISYNPESKLVLSQTGAFLPQYVIRRLSKYVMI
jgi:hypothetical protein